MKQVLEFAQRTVFRHLALIDLTFSKKRPFIEREVKVMLAEPRLVGSLDSCREIVDEKEEALKSQQDFYQAEEGAAGEEPMAQQEQEEQAQEEPDVDPDDPLFGLEQRLKNMNLDDESRRIIREKLDEANQKIKLTLEERQKNLDTKLAGGAGAAGPPKKK